METIYDWMTIALFAALIVLFLQRSTSGEPKDHLWQYLIAAVGCAVTNYLGNEGLHVAAVATLLLVLVFIVWALKPFEGFRR